MGAANVEPAPLRVDEPAAVVAPLDELLLLHAAAASTMATPAAPAAALRETLVARIALIALIAG
jgi:hypothetical protein